MTKVDQLKADIEQLPSEEFAQLCQWLRESDWERWDKQTLCANMGETVE